MTSRIIGSSAADGPRGEHPADERPQPVVLGRVHHDDRLERRFVLLRRASTGRRRGRSRTSPVLVRGDDVGEAGQRVEAVLSR